LNQISSLASQAKRGTSNGSFKAFRRLLKRSHRSDTESTAIPVSCQRDASPALAQLPLAAMRGPGGYKLDEVTKMLNAEPTPSSLQSYLWWYTGKIQVINHTPFQVTRDRQYVRLLSGGQGGTLRIPTSHLWTLNKNKWHKLPFRAKEQLKLQAQKSPLVPFAAPCVKAYYKHVRTLSSRPFQPISHFHADENNHQTPTAPPS
jgi:hypothetical protein